MYMYLVARGMAYRYGKLAYLSLPTISPLYMATVPLKLKGADYHAVRQCIFPCGL